MRRAGSCMWLALDCQIGSSHAHLLLLRLLFLVLLSLVVFLVLLFLYLVFLVVLFLVLVLVLLFPVLHSRPRPSRPRPSVSHPHPSALLLLVPCPPDFYERTPASELSTHSTGLACEGVYQLNERTATVYDISPS